MRLLELLLITILIVGITACGGGGSGGGGGSDPSFINLTIPSDGEVDVSLFPVISVVFSQDMNASTLNNSTFTVKDGGGNPIAGTVAYSTGNMTATFTPDMKLVFDTSYTSTLSTSVQTSDGLNLPSDYSWSFNSYNSLDVFLLIEVSASNADELANIQANIITTIIPSISGKAADSRYGVAVFSDFPFSPFGNYTIPDTAYTLILLPTSSSSAIVSALNNILILDGADIAESHHEALYQLASAEGLVVTAAVDPFSYSIPVGPSNIWRTDALKVIVIVTDSPVHAKTDYDAVFTGSHDATESIIKLNQAEIIVLGVQSGTDSVVSSGLTNITSNTNGESYSSATASGVSTNIITAVETLLGN